MVDKLWLLTQFFEEVYIPQAVWEEAVEQGKRPGVDVIRDFFVGRVKQIREIPGELGYMVDRGEAEAMALYQELDADFLLIDDKKARQIAEIQGVVCIGSLSILVEAKKKNMIEALRPLFLNLIENKRYFSIQLFNSLLMSAGEDPLERQNPA